MDDIGFLEFNTSSDLFKKLKHDYEELLKVQNSNNYLNFILVANHLKDWIDKDDTLSDEEKENASSLLEKSNYKLFKDLANRSKHFKFDPKHPYLKNRKTETKDEFLPAFDFSNGDFNKWNFGDDAYLVEQDGVLINLFQECEMIFNIYTQIFESYIIK